MKTIEGRGMMNGKMFLLVFLFFLVSANISCGADSSEKDLALRWLAAVNAGDVENAIKAATSLTSQKKSMPLNPRYPKICEAFGVKREFISDKKFNAWDFERWEAAALFNRELKQLSANGGKVSFEDLFKFVTKRLESKQLEKSSEQPWPEEIWKRKRGLCDRQAWVLCELAEQCGFDSQIVYLIDKKNSSPHTICEIRDSKGNVWLADPYSEKFLSNVSVAEFSKSDPEKMKFWPKRPEWREAVKNCVFFTPAYPQDYCPRNQELHRKLEKLLGDACPRFASDPEGRLLKYRALVEKRSKAKPVFKTGFWHYPFRLLRAGM